MDKPVRTVHVVPHTHWDRECSGGTRDLPVLAENRH